MLVDKAMDKLVDNKTMDKLVDNKAMDKLLDKTMDKLVENKVTSIGFKVSEENANIGIQRVIVDRARSIEVPSIAGEAN